MQHLQRIPRELVQEAKGPKARCRNHGSKPRAKQVGRDACVSPITSSNWEELPRTQQESPFVLDTTVFPGVPRQQMELVANEGITFVRSATIHTQSISTARRLDKSSNKRGPVT